MKKNNAQWPHGWKVKQGEYGPDYEIFYNHGGRWVCVCGTTGDEESVSKIIEDYRRGLEKGYYEIVNGRFEHTDKYYEVGVPPELADELQMKKSDIGRLTGELWVFCRHSRAEPDGYYSVRAIEKIKEFVNLKRAGLNPRTISKSSTEVGICDEYIARLKKKLQELTPEKGWPKYFLVQEQVDIFKKCAEIQKLERSKISKFVGRYVADTKKATGKWSDEDKRKLDELVSQRKKTLPEILEDLLKDREFCSTVENDNRTKDIKPYET